MKLMRKVLSEMEEFKRFQGSTFDEFSRRRLIENQDTINELTARIQELQNEINCMNDSRDFKYAESVRSGLSHVPSQLVSFPPHPVPGGMLSRSFGMPSRNDKPPDIWDTHGISGNVFVNPPASSSSPYPRGFNPWYVLVHNFLRKLCCGSKKWRWLNQWMISNPRVLSEEFLVQTLSCDARIAPAQNKIIQNTLFKRKVSLEEQKAQKEDRFLRGSQIAYLIYEYFPGHWADDSVDNHADLRTIVLGNDDIQEFDSKWDGILLSMTKIPHDDILEGLYTLRIRESEKLKTVLELYDLETHQKKLGPDYHRLKTMLKRSIEQEIRNKNFGSRNGNFEKNAVVKNQGTKRRVQRILGDCWQWETNGQCVKGDNCSFRHDANKRGKVTPSNPSPNSFMRQNERKPSRTPSPRGKSPSGRMSRWLCKDYFKGSGTNTFCKKWHPPECLFHKTKSGFRFWEKCSYAHRQVDEQPSRRFKKNGDKSAVAILKNTRQLVCVLQDVESPKSSSILRKCSNILKPIRCVKFTKAFARHADIRDQNPSLG